MAKDEKGGTYVSEAQSKAQILRDGRQSEKEKGRVSRLEARAERTDEEQLARLDELFGNGVGAKRERARLQERIKESKNQKPNTPKVDKFVVNSGSYQELEDGVGVSEPEIKKSEEVLVELDLLTE